MSAEKPQPASKRTAKRIQTVHRNPAVDAVWGLTKVTAALVRAKIVSLQGGLGRKAMFIDALDFYEAADEALHHLPLPMPKAISGVRLDTYSLVELTMSLVEAGILKRPPYTCTQDGQHSMLHAESLKTLFKDALHFLYECGETIDQRMTYWNEATAVYREVDWANARLGKMAQRIPVAVVLERAGLGRSTLNPAQLEIVGIGQDWDSLSDGERAHAMFRFLAKEIVVTDRGLRIAHHPSKLVTFYRGPIKIGEPQEVEAMIKNGVDLNDLDRVIEFLQAAKERKETRQRREARKGKGGHRKKDQE